MKREVVSILLLLLVCNIQAFEFDMEIPTLDSLPIPTFVWKILFLLTQWKATDNTDANVKKPEHIAQASWGTYAVDNNNEVYIYRSPTDADGEEPIWEKFAELDGTDVTRFIPYMTETIYAYIEATVPKLSIGGVAKILEADPDPGGDPCLKEIAISAVGKLAGIDCNDDIVTIDLFTYYDGWTVHATQPANDPVKVSIDTFGTIFIVDDQDDVLSLEDGATEWSSLPISDLYDCSDVSVTLEGAQWFACLHEKKDSVAMQWYPGTEGEYDWWGKYNTNVISGANFASAVLLDNKDKDIFQSQIMFFHKLINEQITPLLASLAGEIPTEWPEVPVAP